MIRLCQVLSIESRPPGMGIADPQNSRREFPGISEILAGITGISRVLSFFPIVIVDYDILVFNCLLSKTLNDVFDPTFCVYRFPV